MKSGLLADRLAGEFNVDVSGADAAALGTMEFDARCQHDDANSSLKGVLSPEELKAATEAAFEFEGKVKTINPQHKNGGHYPRAYVLMCLLALQ